MWLLLAVCLPLLPAVVIVTSRYHGEIVSLLRRALTQAAGPDAASAAACVVRDTHSYVFSRCTHGNTDSVLETFDLYAAARQTLSLGPQRGQLLDEVVRRVRPHRVLELGTHCGYCTIRMLRLLPPAGRVVTVELDSYTAEQGEELILVAGFKHSQFQVLTGDSSSTIPTLRAYFSPEPDGGLGVGLLDMVLMDHDPRRYLADLMALESESLLRAGGCHVLLVARGPGATGWAEVLDHARARPERYRVQTQLDFLLELLYREDGAR